MMRVVSGVPSMCACRMLVCIALHKPQMTVQKCGIKLSEPQLCLQSSLTSEMQNVSFGHLEQFHHRHFPDTRHDFLTSHPQDFLKIVALDMASEASGSAFALNFTARHHQPVWEKAPACADEPEHASRRKLRRKKESRTMPKHFYIDDWHRSDFDRGESCYDSTLLYILVSGAAYSVCKNLVQTA